MLSLCSFLALVAAVSTVLLVWHRVSRPQHNLRGEVVLLTGAGGGLGRQLALELAKRDCPLALVDVAQRANEKTATLVRAAAPHLRVIAYTVDLSKREEVNILLEHVFKDFGRVDILLSNAALLLGGGVCDYTDGEVNSVLDVNLRATMLLVRGVLPHMRARRRGRIVAISSAAGIVPNHAMSLYGASKAGLTHFMQCLRRELKMERIEKDIIVTIIHPFFMGTFDLLVKASRVKGWLQWLIPFMEPSTAAQKCIESIARGDHLTFVPSFAKMGTLMTKLLPVCLLDFILENLFVLTFKYLPSYKYRYAKRDIHLLHEFLVKGFEPFCDPQVLFESMDKDCTKNKIKPPYDFSVFQNTLENFYESLRKPVPEVVKKFIEKQ